METITNQLSEDDGQRTVADEETLAESGFYWRERNDVKILVCSGLEDSGFANGFSTRLGGISNLENGIGGNELNLAGFNEDSQENIYENRRRFLELFSKQYELGLAWQVHGDRIRVVENASNAVDSDERADAVISNVENVLCGVKTADCVPVLIGDTRTGAFAAIHAGWRGTAQSIVTKTVIRLGEIYGSEASCLVAAIGPAAGCGRYEVGKDVIKVFEENFSTSGKYFTETRPAHALVDLKAANRDQLIESGVTETNIFVAPYCTMDRIDLFFSYRIEKKKYGRTGRLMSVIGKL